MGGYFRSMGTKAKAGALNFECTLWAPVVAEPKVHLIDAAPGRASASYLPRLIMRARNSDGVGPFWGLCISFRCRRSMAWAKVRVASTWLARL